MKLNYILCDVLKEIENSNNRMCSEFEYKIIWQRCVTHSVRLLLTV